MACEVKEKGVVVQRIKKGGERKSKTYTCTHTHTCTHTYIHTEFCTVTHLCAAAVLVGADVQAVALDKEHGNIAQLGKVTAVASLQPRQHRSGDVPGCVFKIVLVFGEKCRSN